MVEESPQQPCPPTSPDRPGPPGRVRLEVQNDPGLSVVYDVPESGFLVGSVPGCDLRLPGVDLPPLVCLITPRSDGVLMRKLAHAEPLRVNDQAVASASLVDGDRIAFGPSTVVVHLEWQGEPSAASPLPAELEERARLLDERQRQLEQQTQELEADRVIWYQRRQELEQETRPWADVEAIRQELASARQELYESYRKRSDRLAGLQEAIRQAARNLQERKRQVEAEAQQAAARQQEEAARRAELDNRAHELDNRADELTRERQALDELRRQLHAHQQEIDRDLAARLAACQALQAQLEKDRQALQEDQSALEARHQADVIRLDRLQTTLDQRQRQLQARALEVDHRYEQLQRDSRDMEEQAQQMEEWHKKLCAEAERIDQQKAETNPRLAELAQRTSLIEGQQVMLASVRTRLEKMQDEVRREQQQLAQERQRHEEAETDVRRQREEIERLRAEFDRDKQQVEQDRQSFQERAQIMEQAVAQMHKLQEQLAAEEERLKQQALLLDSRAAQLADETRAYQTRSDELLQMQERLAGDRQALRAHEAELARAEQARLALQEQLRRRAEDLAERQRTLAEQSRQREEETAALENQRAEMEQRRQEIAAQTAACEQKSAALTQREETLNQHYNRLKACGRKVGKTRKTLLADRAVCARGLELSRQLPELELRAQAVVESLARARQQLRDHLAELHAYARQSQDDLEDLRIRVQAEAERLRQEAIALHRHRQEHRLAVAAFRQQLIEWQGQVADMRKALAQDETRLERRQAQVEADSARLAKQAEELQEQERQVAQQRDEMDRHLADMREWYRRKLRELSQRQRCAEADSELANMPGAETEEAEAEGPGSPPGSDALPPSHAAEPPAILTMTGDVAPGDRQLGDLLRSLQLVDADTLTALLAEARKQRRSLRHILLASGCVTLYQLALIEAGNLDGLMLGPVRVVDRLRVTPHEAVYRVFDPRRSQEAGHPGDGSALLRHLAEAEMEDPIHPAEFCQRFAAAAAVRHANLAATLEVLDIGGRPAVLQEWPSGLPASDWSALVAVPGVWYRLLSQAAAGLHAAHEAGLVHGHLQPGLIVLTGAGVLKLCGFGEPAWLVGQPASDSFPDDPRSDLLALGAMAAAWVASSAPRRKGAKAKPLPEPLQQILHHLHAEADATYPSAAALLEDLDQVRDQAPSNPAAWERLLRHVRAQETPQASLRQSA